MRLCSSGSRNIVTVEPIDWKSKIRSIYSCEPETQYSIKWYISQHFASSFQVFQRYTILNPEEHDPVEIKPCPRYHWSVNYCSWEQTIRVAQVSREQSADVWIGYTGCATVCVVLRFTIFRCKDIKLVGSFISSCDVPVYWCSFISRRKKILSFIHSFIHSFPIARLKITYLSYRSSRQIYL